MRARMLLGSMGDGWTAEVTSVQALQGQAGAPAIRGRNSVNY